MEFKGGSWSTYRRFGDPEKRECADSDSASIKEWYGIASENKDLVVLFCNRPAELENVCQSWTPIPQHGYLVAPIRCIQQLSKENGGNETKAKLAPNLYWQRRKNGKVFESCSVNPDDGCNRAQKLNSREPPAEVSLHELDGAVIFGGKNPDMPPCCPTAQSRESESTVCTQNHVHGPGGEYIHGHENGERSERNIGIRNISAHSGSSLQNIVTRVSGPSSTTECGR